MQYNSSLILTRVDLMCLCALGPALVAHFIVLDGVKFLKVDKNNKSDDEMIVHAILRCGVVFFHQSIRIDLFALCFCCTGQTDDPL